MSRGIFVTGTDTGVGKTLVAAGIFRYLRNLGMDAVPVKPVQTGGTQRDGVLTAPDLDYSLAVSGLGLEADEVKLMSPYVYEPACSPHLAGRLAGSYPEILKITGSIEELLERHTAVVVEGAGGILVPLNETETMLDLMKALGFPVVLVSRPSLGTINHTLLSIEVLRSAGLSLIGVVFNHLEDSVPGNEDIENDNPGVIARFGDVQVLGNIPYFTARDVKNGIWEDFDRNMPGLDSISEAVTD
mgnify:FL=1